jgi:drug/metabolite transporter (DMT)-like permease
LTLYGTDMSARPSSLLATLAVPALALLWGLNWPVVRVLLDRWSPWQLRLVGLGSGAALLLALALWRGLPLRVPAGQRARLLISALLSLVGFNLCTAFAQLHGSTARATILTYAMPVWVVLLAWPVVRERPDLRRTTSVLCAAVGIVLLAAPLVQSGAPLLGAFLALGAGLSWAAGTVFLKRWPIDLHPIVATGWQLLFAAGIAALGGAIALGWVDASLAADGLGAASSAAPHVAGHPASRGPAPVFPLWAFVAALAFHVLGAMALGYLLWFEGVSRLPAGIAALSTLLVPVVGVLGAMALLGERPSWTDWGGLVLISVAAGLVLRPAAR